MSAPADDERFAYFVVVEHHAPRPRMLRAQVINVTPTGVRFARPVPLEDRDRITMQTERVDYTPAAALARAQKGSETSLEAARAIVESVAMRRDLLMQVSADQLPVEDV